MNRLQRTSPVVTFTFAIIGVSAGLLLQFARSAAGSPPLVPPLSLALTMLVLGAVLLGLGIALRRAVTRKSGRPVNPFHAVRLLAGARAGQFVGSLLGGFGAGLFLQLLTRSVMPPAASWVPMIAVVIGGIALVICGYAAELLCRVPPNTPEEGEDRGVGEPEPGTA